MHSRKVFQGQVYKNISGSEFVVLDYKDSKNVMVQFLDDTRYEISVKSSDILRGKIKNPLFPSVSGVGFIGIGPHKSEDGKGRPTKAYTHWSSMLNRCYAHGSGASYEDCFVCEEWHSFQNFANWAVTQVGYNTAGWELDKDILSKGNKEYNPECCRFVPKRLNLLLMKSASRRGEYPIGVYFHKASQKYMARCGGEYLGLYETANDAFYSYKKRKEEIIKQVAQDYVGIVCDDVIIALMAYEVSVDD